MGAAAANGSPNGMLPQQCDEGASTPAPAADGATLPAANDTCQAPAAGRRTSIRMGAAAANASPNGTQAWLSKEDVSAPAPAPDGATSLAVDNTPAPNRRRSVVGAAAKAVQSAVVMLTPRSLVKPGAPAPAPAPAPSRYITIPPPGFASKRGRASAASRAAAARNGEERNGKKQLAASASGTSRTRLLADPDAEPTTLLEVVAADAQRSPSWRKYQLSKQVWRMMVDKDRTLPMTPAARSPRHIMEQSKRLVAPPKPKIVAKKRKVTAEELEAASRLHTVVDDKPQSLCDRVKGCFDGIGQTICSIWDGFLGQDLEVQMILIFLAISAFMSALGEVRRYLLMSKYEYGRAPPAPPTMPDWTVSVEESSMGYALGHPAIYLLVDFGVAVVIGIVVLFWEDIRAWNKARQLRSRGRTLWSKGYSPLKNKFSAGKVVDKFKQAAADAADGEGSFTGSSSVSTSPRSRAAAIVDPDEGDAKQLPLTGEADLRRELARETDRVEELEIKLKIHSASGSAASSSLARRHDLDAI